MGVGGSREGVGVKGGGKEVRGRGNGVGVKG